MKILTIAFSCLFLCISESGFGTILRVNNNPVNSEEPDPTAPYVNFSSAHDAAVDGDTIILEPGNTSYGGIWVSKRLVILGNGCFLHEHDPPLLEDTRSSKVNYLYMVEGSAGSIAMGLTAIGSIGSRIQEDSILLMRNNFRRLFIYQNVTYARIFQNWIQEIIGIDNPYQQDHVYIFNNIIEEDIKFQDDDQDIYVINNIIAATNPNDEPTLYNAIIRNNIFVNLGPGKKLYSEGSLIQNNLVNITGFFSPADTVNNKEGVNMDDVFVMTGATDEQFQLLGGGGNPNPAIGYGFYSGEDCGAFDVPDVAMFDQYAPFQIGCLPPIPLIYEYSIQQNGGNLEIEMSAKSNN